MDLNKRLEELSKRDEWTIGDRTFKLDKLNLRDGLGVQRRLARLLGPALSALVGAQHSQQSKAAKMVADLAKRARAEGLSPTTESITEQLQSDELADELAALVTGGIAEALERFVFAVGDPDAEADLWYILERYIGSAWVLGKAKAPLADVSEALFPGRWDLVWRFVAASTVRNFGSFLADMGLIDLLPLSVVPGSPSTSPHGSTPTPKPSHTASPPLESTATL